MPQHLWMQPLPRLDSGLGGIPGRAGLVPGAPASTVVPSMIVPREMSMQMTIDERVRSWASSKLNGPPGDGPHILPADITDLLLVPSTDDHAAGDEVVLVCQYLDKDGEMDAVSFQLSHNLVELVDDIMRAADAQPIVD